MAGVIAAATGSDWNAGGSLMTFYFPVGLFVVVATTLYLQFSRPHKTPGHAALVQAAAPASAATAGTQAGSTASPAVPADPAGQDRAAGEAAE
jgi:hypothetical protein